MSSLTTTTGMEESLEEFDTRLCLGIGGGSRPPVRLDELFPPPQEHGGHGRGHQEPVRSSRNKGSTTATGGASATARRNKKARTRGGDVDGDRRSPRDGGDAADGARKKLRLTEEQAALLEDSFRAHNILSHGEKHDLARRLGLSARQVEVWFQNRRARTKLKQTEMDFVLLRRWCERLCDDNARLRRELAEARSSSAVTRLTMVNNAACPSCNKLALVAGGQTAP